MEDLEQLKFWLSSIEVHGDSYNADTEDSSLCLPPVALVWTHFDEVKSMAADTCQKLMKINIILVDALNTLKVLQINDESLIETCTFLYNN